jgi:hypothetical protein
MAKPRSRCFCVFRQRSEGGSSGRCRAVRAASCFKGIKRFVGTREPFGGFRRQSHPMTSPRPRRPRRFDPPAENGPRRHLYRIGFPPTARKVALTRSFSPPDIVQATRISWERTKSGVAALSRSTRYVVNQSGNGISKPNKKHRRMDERGQKSCA